MPKQIGIPIQYRCSHTSILVPALDDTAAYTQSEIRLMRTYDCDDCRYRKAVWELYSSLCHAEETAGNVR